MSATATVVIRSNGILPPQAVMTSAGTPVTQAQQQTTIQPALEQRQLLRSALLLPATTFFLEDLRDAFTEIAKRSAYPFEVTLEQRGTVGVGITVQGAHSPPPLHQSFKGFEIPSFSDPKKIYFILRPSLNPQEGARIEFDLGAFLFSRGHGIEDCEPNWYEIRRNASVETIMKWFESWLSEGKTGRTGGI